MMKETDVLLQAVTQAYRMDETLCVQTLLARLATDGLAQDNGTACQIEAQAIGLVEAVRAQVQQKTGIQAFISHYDLSTEEGIMLMCLAEALLRIPDKQTEDLLIRDKLSSGHWTEHINQSESAFVNMATWGLALTGKVLTVDQRAGFFHSIWQGLLARCGEPIIRQAIWAAIKLMGEQFVVARTIEQAVQVSTTAEHANYLYSFDMLGEVARTQEDADHYFAAYRHAIQTLGQQQKIVVSVPTVAAEATDLLHHFSISVKLSALYPRYEFTQRDLAVPALTARLHELAVLCQQAQIGLTVDAEEADRLEMSLDIFAAVFQQPELAEWEGLGLAVQAYQKRALPVLEWLSDLVGRTPTKQGGRIPVRLVKGAYWDSEIKQTQVGGFVSYPVFTRKEATDVSFLACAQYLLAAPQLFYPQLATHNAYSIAAILHMTRNQDPRSFEFQSLYGMGRELHDHLRAQGYTCRIYAPVGSHEQLLPYLMRRLLENGANSSFVNQIAHPATPIDKLISNPCQKLMEYMTIPHPKIPLPAQLYQFYGEQRLNSFGVDLSHAPEQQQLAQQMQPFRQPIKIAKTAKTADAITQKIVNPAHFNDVVGHIHFASEEDLQQAVSAALAAFTQWNAQGVESRAQIMERAAQLIEQHRGELVALVVREAGRTIVDALSEIREAVDYCRYYSQLAREQMAPQPLPGPVGESNYLQLQGRGVMACISPWNFPIAIFTGQIVAALVTGNTVLAKSAPQTPLTAQRMIELFYAAGLPPTVLQHVPGDGKLGAALVATKEIAGVLFTGSTASARQIAKTLAQRDGPIIPFIAETGGVNAMIADSSTLPEQLIADVLSSAFGSAGQRCSSLRMLFVQQDISDRVITLLQGAMAELRVGNPWDLQTDIGPVIDQAAHDKLLAHSALMKKSAQLIFEVSIAEEMAQQGYFVAPQAYELADLSLLKQEVFGPILHVIRYQRDELNGVVDAINALGYGLTFGVHSRIRTTMDALQQRICAGNIYINRPMIGAVVGVQPFGGSRLSGTGPKAGGPHYLSRLCHEVTFSENTAAIGGNVSLMAL